MIQNYIYDRSGNLINDPERTRLTGGRGGSLWPKGFSSFSADARRDILHAWAVRGAYRLVVRDGQRVLFDGRLRFPNREVKQNGATAGVEAAGWYAVLAERQIGKRWIDTQALERLRWPAGRVSNTDQNRAVVSRNGNQVRVAVVPDNYLISGTTQYHEQYTAPAGSITRVKYDYAGRTGQGLNIQIYNDDNATAEHTETVLSTSETTGSVDHTLTGGATQSVTIKIYPDTYATYDQNDWVALNTLTIYTDYESGHSVSSPAYKTGELVEDVILLAGSEISADVSLLGEPATTLAAIAADGFEPADSILQRLAGYGDASLNTWGVSVWDGEQSSDGLPRVEFVARDVSDYDYEMSIAELDSFSAEETDDELFNWVIVSYKDEINAVNYITPDDDASLKDADSITAYGQRDALLEVGQATSTYAIQAGKRFLAYHSEPLNKMKFTLTGNVRRKDGAKVPALWMRAGERIKLVDYNDGTTFFLRQLDFDITTGRVSGGSDIPPDDLAILMTRQEL